MASPCPFNRLKTAEDKMSETVVQKILDELPVP